MIRAVLCDIGNVLVTFDFAKAMHRAAAQADATAEEISALVHSLLSDHETGRISSPEFLRTVAERTGYRGSMDELRTAYCEIFSPNPQAWPLIDALRTAVPVYLFSNTSEAHQDYLFSEYDVFQRIDGGVYSWSAGSMKPDRPIYEAALQLTGCAPEELAYLDDLAPNLEAGRALGIHAIRYDARDPQSHAEACAALAALGLPVA